MDVIRVADRTRDLDAFGGDRFSEEYEAAVERVLKTLFGTGLGCDDDWEETAEEFDEAVGRDKAVAFCLERGYDIRRHPTDGAAELVPCWRDIGIMLMARDRGLIG